MINSAWILSDESNLQENAPDYNENQENETANDFEAKRRKVAAPDEWAYKKKNILRNLGQQYTSKSGNVVPPRVMNPFSHKCRYFCNDNFTENDRQEIFDNFWQEGNFDRQNLFLLSCVQIVVPKRPKADAVKPKSASRACYLNGKRVCREFLLRTLDISHGRFNRLCEKVQASPSEIPSDQRGKHGNRNRIPEDAIRRVKNHISSFPTYMSHYSG